MKPLTYNTARVKARKRWGKSYAISLNERAPLKPEKDLIRTLYAGLPIPRSLSFVYGYRCQVGEITHGGMAFRVHGGGDTWEEAFAQADRQRLSL